jgi:hypothetical protein
MKAIPQLKARALDSYPYILAAVPTVSTFVYLVSSIAVKVAKKITFRLIKTLTRSSGWPEVTFGQLINLLEGLSVLVPLPRLGVPRDSRMAVSRIDGSNCRKLPPCKVFPLSTMDEC